VVLGAIREELEGDVPHRRFQHRSMPAQFADRFADERFRDRSRPITNRDSLDLDALGWNGRLRGNRGDLLRHADALGDAREDGVLPIERRLIGDGDEELRAAAVPITGHEHRRHSAARVLLGVALEAQHAEPALPVLRRLTGILRQRIPALDDAHGDYTVERRAVVGALARARHEMRDVVRRRVVQQVENDGPVARLEHGLFVLDLGRRQCGGEKCIARRRRFLRARALIRNGHEQHQREQEHRVHYLLYSPAG
jgi:hypothetical protein